MLKKYFSLHVSYSKIYDVLETLYIWHLHLCESSQSSDLWSSYSIAAWIHCPSMSSKYDTCLYVHMCSDYDGCPVRFRLRNLQFSTASVWCLFGGFGVFRNIVMSETKSPLIICPIPLEAALLEPPSVRIQTDCVFKKMHYAHHRTSTTMPFAAINCQIASWRTRVFVNVFTGRTDLEQQQNRCFDAWWWWRCGCRCLQVDEAKEQ